MPLVEPIRAGTNSSNDFSLHKTPSEPSEAERVESLAGVTVNSPALDKFAEVSICFDHVLSFLSYQDTISLALVRKSLYQACFANLCHRFLSTHNNSLNELFALLKKKALQYKDILPPSLQLKLSQELNFSLPFSLFFFASEMTGEKPLATCFALHRLLENELIPTTEKLLFETVPNDPEVKKAFFYLHAKQILNRDALHPFKMLGLLVPQNLLKKIFPQNLHVKVLESLNAFLEKTVIKCGLFGFDFTISVTECLLNNNDPTIRDLSRKNMALLSTFSPPEAHWKALGEIFKPTPPPPPPEEIPLPALPESNPRIYWGKE